MIWKKSRGRKKWFLVFTLLLCLFLSGCDEDEDDIYTFNGAEPKEIDPWVYIQDTAISTSVPIRSFASSAGALGITLGVIGILFSIIVMAIRIFFFGNVKTKSEVKEEAVLKGLIAVMIFSVPLWLGICKMLSEMLV